LGKIEGLHCVKVKDQPAGHLNPIVYVAVAEFRDEFTMAARRKTKTGKGDGETGGHGPKNGAKPSSRPVWQGHLRLSLVSCPVALYGATSHAENISFHLLNPDTKNRIRMVPTDPDTGSVDRGDLVKGYELSKNHYVVLNDKDLDAVKLDTTHSLEIERFVDERDVDRLLLPISPVWPGNRKWLRGHKKLFSRGDRKARRDCWC
jgi:hypothetical protein